MGRLSSRVLSHRVTVQRAARTHDGQGGFTEVWATLTASFQCRLTDTKLTQRADENGALRSDVVRTMYCWPGSDIYSGDRVVVGTVPWLVEAADDQPDNVYRKVYLLAEQRGV
jgi:head-tail adaptor